MCIDILLYYIGVYSYWIVELNYLIIIKVVKKCFFHQLKLELELKRDMVLYSLI